MIAFTASIEPLRLANRVSGENLFAWSLHSVDGQPVRASNGIPVMVDGAYAAASDIDDVVVCAGVNVHLHDHRVLVAQLRRLALKRVAIGAVCTGTHVLAQAGLLDGYRCTIHWENQASFAEAFPQIDLTDELYEFDRNRFTCAGGTAAIDMMLSRVSARNGRELAALVSDELIHHRIRPAHERQRMQMRERLGVSNPKLVAVVDLMERTLGEPLACAELARRVQVSPRQLERLFAQHLNETPSRYYMMLRLMRAQQLLQQSDMPILSIALACGFVSASHFSKCYAEHLKRTPSDERRAYARQRGPARPRVFQTSASGRKAG
jgi:transcriptional regulator GlxA family with amidase domain